MGTDVRKVRPAEPTAAGGQCSMASGTARSLAEIRTENLIVERQALTGNDARKFVAQLSLRNSPKRNDDRAASSRSRSRHRHVSRRYRWARIAFTRRYRGDPPVYRILAFHVSPIDRVCEPRLQRASGRGGPAVASAHLASCPYRRTLAKGMRANSGLAGAMLRS